MASVGELINWALSTNRIARIREAARVTATFLNYKDKVSKQVLEASGLRYRVRSLSLATLLKFFSRNLLPDGETASSWP